MLPLDACSKAILISSECTDGGTGGMQQSPPVHRSKDSALLFDP